MFTSWINKYFRRINALPVQKKIGGMDFKIKKDFIKKLQIPLLFPLS